MQLLVSTGRKLIAFSITQGMPVAEAEAIIKAAPWTRRRPPSRSSTPKMPKDTVIAALGADGTTNLIGTASYGEEQTLHPGGLGRGGPRCGEPDLSRRRAAPSPSVKLTAPEGDHAFSDTVPEGNVIGLEVPDGTFLHPGDIGASCRSRTGRPRSPCPTSSA